MGISWSNAVDHSSKHNLLYITLIMLCYTFVYLLFAIIMKYLIATCNWITAYD